MSTTMSIEDLPDHVLGLILNECTPEEWNRLEQVCPQWRRVVESHLGIIMVKGTVTGVRVNSEQSLNRFLLKDAYASSVPALVLKKIASTVPLKSAEDNTAQDKKSETDLEIPVVQNIEIAIPEVKRAAFIRKLSFVGPIPLIAMGSIMNSCKTLFGLHFHFSTLSGITDVDFLKMDVPTLKTLVIDAYGISEEAEASGQHPDFIDFTQCFRVMVNLLNQNNFMHLQKLILDIPYCEDNENVIISTVSNFLSRHKSSIRSFSYHQGFVAVLKKDENEDTEEDEINDAQVPLRSLAEYATNLKNVSLDEIQIHLACPQDSDPLWKNFILHQKHLKKLVYTGNSRIPFPSNTIHENRKTLDTIVLSIRDTVDLQAITDCPNLKKLVLMSKPNSERDEFTSMDSPDVRNLKSLPSSLENLSIRYLTILRSDAESIINGRLPNLKNLELFDCGTEDNYGVPIQMIGKIWETKTLPKFAFRFSLNRKSLSEEPLPTSVSLLAYSLKANYSITEFEIDGYLDDKKNYTSCLSFEDDAIFEQAQGDIFTFPDEVNAYGGMDVAEYGNESGSDTSDDDYETMTEASSSAASSTDGD